MEIKNTTPRTNNIKKNEILGIKFSKNSSNVEKAQNVLKETKEFLSRWKDRQPPLTAQKAHVSDARCPG